MVSRRSTPVPDSGSEQFLVDPSPCTTLRILESAEIVGGAQVQLGSNYTFLVHLDTGGEGQAMRAIYKPRDGERPLADYPEGTLYLREYATFLTSEALGWPSIPLTVIRDGPYGPGSMQKFVEFDPGVTYFNLRESRIDELASFAAFDLLVNNGDRKGGHFLQDHQGKVWSVDHGLTFHTEFKMRTVMMEFCGKPIPEALVSDLCSLAPDFEEGGKLSDALRELISGTEVDSLRARLNTILETPIQPMLDPYLNAPWPLV